MNFYGILVNITTKCRYYCMVIYRNIWEFFLSLLVSVFLLRVFWDARAIKLVNPYFITQSLRLSCLLQNAFFFALKAMHKCLLCGMAPKQLDRDCYLLHFTKKHTAEPLWVLVICKCAHISYKQPAARTKTSEGTRSDIYVLHLKTYTVYICSGWWQRSEFIYMQMPGYSR